MALGYGQVKMKTLIRLVPALMLGIAAAVLVSCGSTGASLIPAASAGPLQKDFEAVARAAKSGDGNCVETESALGKTEQDFLALPETVDRGLRARLDQGISNLSKQALAMCAQPSAETTATTNTPTTTTQTHTTTTSTQTTTTTPPTATTPTSTTNTQTTQTTTTPTNQSGGTSPGEGSGEGAAGANKEGEAGAPKEGAAGANNEVSGVGGASPGGGQ
jgi:hypothetical protein